MCKRANKPIELLKSGDFFCLARKQLAESRLTGIALAWLFSAFLLFGQGADLSHSHEGDLKSQVDCEICFVTGTLGQAISASGLVLDLSPALVDFDPLSTSPINIAPPVSKARAPPLS